MDERWVKKLNGQDIDAFEDLYKTYYSSLVVYALNFLDREDAAQDLVQEVIVYIWENKVSFINEVTLKSYLFNAVRNRCLNYLKHQQVTERYSIEIMNNDLSDAVSDDEIWREEMYSKIYAEINKLPNKCRQVFLLHIDGKKNSEIAEILNMSVFAVKMQKKRAMNALRENLAIINMIIFMLPK